ncbi:LPXTG_cell wall anchor domain-containing protein [Hexamita inflata]|uniref:LPXTG cell wall anchor domain-containing protein n=1 Tax=Hexamita inflata TaxID=28002 RepID=A0AA86TN80_9EUKA|nr:LPXTG cell wall anchor domain-containing protein [Hexamita inflata]CAI9941236.1 LPXTG cell wall anchor domain-containing protein [Hexamita inflata]
MIWLNDLQIRSNNLLNSTLLLPLINLQKLDISENEEIHEIQYLDKLTNLVELNLSQTNLQQKDISSLSQLTNLKKLYLNFNQLSDVSALSALTSMQELNLTYNTLQNLNDIQNMMNLQILVLLGNTGINISILKNFINLTELCLHDLGLKEVDTLQCLYNITNLTLTQNELIEVCALHNMHKLNILDVRFNRIYSFVPILHRIFQYFRVEDQSEQTNEDIIKSKQVHKIYKLNNILYRCGKIKKIDHLIACFKKSVLKQLKQLNLQQNDLQNKTVFLFKSIDVQSFQ